MPKYQHKETGVIVEAFRFDARELRWPRYLDEWPDNFNWQPSDGSVGFIDTSHGRVHVWDGHWILTDVDGVHTNMPDADFNARYDALDDEAEL